MVVNIIFMYNVKVLAPFRGVNLSWKLSVRELIFLKYKKTVTNKYNIIRETCCYPLVSFTCDGSCRVGRSAVPTWFGLVFQTLLRTAAVLNTLIGPHFSLFSKFGHRLLSVP